MLWCTSTSKHRRSPFFHLHFYSLLHAARSFWPNAQQLIPALDGVPRVSTPTELADQTDTSVVLFAAPKKKTSHSRRRLRMTHQWMKDDQSIHRCPTCNAFKKRHVALHCATPSEKCGLGMLISVGPKILSLLIDTTLY